LPLVQGVCEEALAHTLPARQGVSVLEPVGQYEPTPQVEHAVVLVVLAKVPAAQGSHTLEPCTLE
jgi:hypothetical protein